MQTPPKFAIVCRCLDNRKPRGQADTNRNKSARVTVGDSWSTKKTRLRKM